MDALDVVMAGNSCGDIVAALQTLPGTQTVGEDGKLYVRGGESEECQTFVNGMHVLVPYSTNTENTAVRKQSRSNDRFMTDERLIHKKKGDIGNEEVTGICNNSSTGAWASKLRREKRKPKRGQHTGAD
jgi:hypothetical protein